MCPVDNFMKTYVTFSLIQIVIYLYRSSLFLSKKQLLPALIFTVYAAYSKLRLFKVKKREREKKCNPPAKKENWNCRSKLK